MKQKYNDSENSALKAGIWYVISSILVKAISVISTPIFTRIMTTEQYGIVSIFTSWFSLLLPLTSLNLVYSIGRAKIDYPNKLNEYLGAMQTLSLLSTLLFAGLAWIFINPFSKLVGLNSELVVLLIVYLVFTPAITLAQCGYRYQYKYKQNIAIAWFISIGTVVVSLSLLWFVNAEKEILRIIGIISPSIVLGLFFWVRSIRLGFINCNTDYWKYGVKISAPLILHTVSLYILTQADRILIANICGNSEAGIYSLVYNYGMLLSMITSAISEGWQPWLHDNYHKKNFDLIRKKTITITLLGCYIALAAIAVAPEAIRILGGEEYMDGVYCVMPIVLGILCQFIYSHYVNIEVHLKQTKYVSLGTMIAASLNMVLNLVFIPHFGYVAAAYTTLCSYIVLMISHYLITRVILRVNPYNDYILFCSFVLTAAVSVLLELTYPVVWLRYLIVLLGFLCFMATFRNYWIGFVKEKLFKFHI